MSTPRMIGFTRAKHLANGGMREEFVYWHITWEGDRQITSVDHKGGDQYSVTVLLPGERHERRSVRGDCQIGVSR